MMHYETIWQFETKQFRIVFDVTEDYDVDLSWDEDGSIREGLESGKYMCFIARVSVWYDGDRVGADYLGGCIYESAQAFMDHRGLGYYPLKPKGEPVCGSYFADMVREAIKAARHNLRRPRPYIRAA